MYYIQLACSFGIVYPQAREIVILFPGLNNCTNRWQYKHLNAPTPETDYLPLQVEVFDPVQSDAPIKENIYVPITIRGAFPNLPPKASFTSSFMMDADEFILTTVEPSVIAAVDEETPDELLVFNISRALGPDEGFLVNVKDHTRPIMSFLQEDLVNLNIAYMPPPISLSQRKV